MSYTAGSVIVTGAAAGLGKAIAVEFVQRGSSVVLVDTAGDALHATEAEINSLGLPGSALAAAANIADEQSAAAVFERAAAVFGRVDALVNCAGGMDSVQAVGEHALPLWHKVVNGSLHGPLLLCRLAVQEFLRAAGGGVIVNIAAVAGARGGSAGAAHTTSKWSMVGLTKSTAAAYAQQGVRCNVICPGSADTRISDNISDHMGCGSASELFSTVMKLSAMSPGPMDTGRLARLVAFLCSDDGQGINGAVIRVDRGWTAV